MDLAIALAGAVVGLIASALPGLHVNLLATAMLLVAPIPAAVPFILGAFAASPFGVALSSTFIGGPADDAALSSLPAQTLAREGRTREAVALQTWGALLGIVLAIPLAVVLRAILVPLAPHLARAMPWILAVIVFALVMSEPRRLPIPVRVRWGERVRAGDLEIKTSRALGRLAALGVLLLAGALGLAAFRLGSRSPLGWPSSALLPLLAGLFAAPTLVASALAPPLKIRAYLRAPRERFRELLRGAWPGSAVSVVLGLAPGVSASHAALLAPPAGSPERALIRLAAVNGGAIVFTLLAWHTLDKARAGALVVAGQLAPPAEWSTWSPPPAVVREASLIVAAALVAMLGARWLSAHVARAPARPLAMGGLLLLIASVAVFNGALGLGVLAVAALVGALPARLGLRRSHAMGVILIPALLRAWGLQ